MCPSQDAWQHCNIGTKCRESCVGKDRAHEMRTNLVLEPRENYCMQCDCQKVNYVQSLDLKH